MVYNISSNFLETYINFHSKKKMSLAEMFKHLSFELGGDGTKITKDQLDSYIEKAESGSIKTSKQKLSALKQIQKNWDTISKGDGSIDLGDMQNYKVLLILASIGSFEMTKIPEASGDEEPDAYESLVKALGLSSIEELKNVKDSDLNTYLQTLLADSSSDDENSDKVALLTNLIASYNNNSTVDEEA